MINFRKITPKDREMYLPILQSAPQRGCEYAFANLCIWGHQQAAMVDGFLALFSQFGRISVYPFPLGQGDVRPVLEALFADAKERGLACRLSSMTKEDCDLLEQLYPGQFHFYTDRDDYDYVYAISDLAQLKGKRFQSKRNFSNRFWAQHPDCQAVILDDTNLPAAREMLDLWFAQRQRLDSLADFYLEQSALEKALSHREMLSMEGMVLMERGQVLAFTLGSPLSQDTFDIHFEKALDGIDGAYAAINQSFSQYLMETYPQLLYLDREDDLGIEGLRKAKLSYHPHHLVEKFWAQRLEDDHGF